MEHPHTFERTNCACDRCIACCKRQPGPLAPGDLERIAAYLHISKEEAKRYFWASPGCLVRTNDGDTRRIGTITPRYAHGKCVFLDKDNKCRIHPVAPFGCSHFDTHMSAERAMERSVYLATAQAIDPDYQALRNELPYARHHKPLKLTLGQ